VEKEIKDYTKAGFVLKPNAPEIKDLFLKIKKEFESAGIEVFLESKSAKMIGYEGLAFSKLCQSCDFFVSLGGDGTLLSLVRRSYKCNKPVAGINAGNLGFLADVTIGEVEAFLKQLRAGECRIDERMMINGKIEGESKEINFYAFNDAVITRPTISKMATIEVCVDDELINSYRGDGLIVSTPTGSTAYNLAADGPVMYPLTKAFILTPICPHSLTQRPLVMPADFTINIKTPNKKLVVVIDGQDSYELDVNDTLTINGACKSAKLLHRKERNYFRVLRDKLSWGE
jgi:NAD+ kinase